MLALLRHNTIVAGILSVIRIYLGYSWFTSGWVKITGGGFDARGFIQGAIAKSSGENSTIQSWWATFLENAALPNTGIFSFLVMWGELLVGIGLILGIFTTFAALMGIVMNFSFLLSGTISTNPQMISLTIFVLVAGANAGKFGLNKYVKPYLKKTFD